jgi:carnosine N-methyltransferase
MADDARSDQVSFMRTVRAFREYSQQALFVLDRRERDMRELSPAHAALLGMDVTTDIFDPHRAAVAHNQKLLDAMADASSQLFAAYWPGGALQPSFDAEPTALDMEKVSGTLRQVVRDWATDGEGEREPVYGRVRQVLQACFPDRSKRGPVNILVPGAGLSRLSVELCSLGFASQGNEFSYHMLIAGHYLMNHVDAAEQHVLQPYCDSTINSVSRRDQFHAVPVPDLTTYDMMDSAEDQGGEFGELSMVAGDFVEVYSKPEHHGRWAALVTCFFIDTAHNIIEYLEVMHRLLRPGGVWVNAGPLLYHFSDVVKDTSIDLSLEEVKAVAGRVGFAIEQEEWVQASYASNPRAMKRQVFNCAFWVARKK